MSAADGYADQTPGVVRYEPPYGNHVFIDPGSEMVKFAHLRPGSVAVSTGDQVTGQLLGEVGNSGNTTEPHLHIHAERDGIGLGLRFDGIIGTLHRGRTPAHLPPRHTRPCASCGPRSRMPSVMGPATRPRPSPTRRRLPGVACGFPVGEGDALLGGARPPGLVGLAEGGEDAVADDEAWRIGCGRVGRRGYGPQRGAQLLRGVEECLGGNVPDRRCVLLSGVG